MFNAVKVNNYEKSSVFFNSKWQNIEKYSMKWTTIYYNLKL